MPGTPPVSLVPAAISDLELLISYMRQLRRDDPMPCYDFADEAAVQKSLENLIADSEIGRIWLIRAGDVSAGYAALSFIHILEFAGRCAMLDEFFVHPDHRRQGVARAALNWICESAAPTLGVRAIFLEVSPDNAAATGLYRSAGFGPRSYHLMMRCTADTKDAS